MIRSVDESRASTRRDGTRGARVQQVVAERKEQSLSGPAAEDEDAGAAAAAQAESSARVKVKSGIGCEKDMVGQGEARPAPSR